MPPTPSRAPSVSQPAPAAAAVTLADRYLTELHSGDSGAAERLLPLVYNELRAMAQQLMQSERAGHTLNPTSLLHEAMVRLISAEDLRIRGRNHFFALGATAMRRILADYGRRRRAQRRGGGAVAQVANPDAFAGTDASDIDLLELNDLLARLGALNPRHARVVELRFLAGMSVQDVAEVLGVSVSTVEADWRTARTWLAAKLGRGDPA